MSQTTSGPVGIAWVARRCTASCAATLLLLLLTAADVRGQSLDAPAGPGPRPFDLLIESGSNLGLSDSQLEQLRTLRDQLAAANEPLVRRLLQLRAEWQAGAAPSARVGASEPAGRGRLRVAAASLRMRIQRNNRRTMREVGRVLTPAQRAGLRALVDERRRQRGESAGEGAADAGSPD
jgi:Spy/CpxP family protein refolding chaperone